MQLKHNNRWLRPYQTLVVLVISLSVPWATPTAFANDFCPELATEVTGNLPNGAEFVCCTPNSWNRRLGALISHGTNRNEATIDDIASQLELDEVSILGILNTQGIASGVVSRIDLGFSQMPQAIDELIDLKNACWGTNPPNATLVAGISQGANIATRAVELYPAIFNGGLAACGPIGDFRKQLNYSGDLLNLFNVFFKDIIEVNLLDKDAVTGNPVIPAGVQADWDRIEEAIETAIVEHWDGRTQEYLRTAKIPKDSDPERVAEEIRAALEEVVFLLEDVIATLGGNPYDNRRKWYWGSDNDFLLNLKILRFRADQVALAEIEANYQTSGALSVPHVSLHTLRDPRVPFWHEILYTLKTWRQGTQLLHTTVPTLSYGHCNFELSEALTALGILVFQVSGEVLPGAEAVLQNTDSQQ